MAVERGSIQCGAKCDAIVAGNGLNVLLHRTSQNASTYHLPCNSGTLRQQEQACEVRLLSETRTNVKNNSLEALLQCRGNVLVSLPDFFVRATPWNQIGVKNDLVAK